MYSNLKINLVSLTCAIWLSFYEGEEEWAPFFLTENFSGSGKSQNPTSKKQKKPKPSISSILSVTCKRDKL